MNTIEPDPRTVSAITVLPIEYLCSNKGAVLIPAGTHIKVDVENQIALIGTDHVAIDTHEYSPLYN
jgi:hypothetical protein